MEKLILITLCNHYDITPVELFKRTNKRIVSEKRQTLFHLLYNLLKKKTSLEKIGKLSKEYNTTVFDHTTVLHGIRKIDGLLQTDKPFKRDYKEIKDLIREAQLLQETELPKIKDKIMKLVVESTSIDKLQKTLSTYCEFIKLQNIEVVDAEILNN